MKIIVPSIALIVFSMLVASCSTKIRRQATLSMEPTIKRGELVRVDFSAYRSDKPKRWDVVLFETPHKSGGEWVKRVVGLPGETVDFSGGELMIDGRSMRSPSHFALPLYTPPISDETRMYVYGVSQITYPYKIGSNQFFVIGDNVQNSLDSRYFGAIERVKILGRVLEK